MLLESCMNLVIKVTATGFLGGKIGEFIESELEQSPVSSAFYRISGNTRNCIPFTRG